MQNSDLIPCTFRHHPYNAGQFAYNRLGGAAMPKRDDIKSIMIIGAGPIIIGQACEFDYSGAQACKALREEGYRVILVNSNPATIMTDPDMADATYIEPITPEVVAKIIEKERPDALLPTMGGQTALNTSLALDDNGVLAKFDVELIGANRDAIEMAADRKLDSKQFRKANKIKRFRFATRDEVVELTGLQPGSIPPFGHLFDLPTNCDNSLSQQDCINFNAGDHSISIGMKFHDYAATEQPTLADFTQTPE